MKKKSGFTLIEMIVVIGVISITIPTIFSLMFLSFQSQKRVKALASVKQSGDYTLSVMQSLIRQYANSIYSIGDISPVNQICSSAGDEAVEPLYFKDDTDHFFNFAIQDGRIASYSGTMVYYLTPEDVVADDTTFSMSCTRLTDFDPPLVTIDFPLSVGQGKLRREEKATLRYQTKVKLRNL